MVGEEEVGRRGDERVCVEEHANCSPFDSNYI